MNTFLKNLSAKRWLGIILIVLLGMVAYHNCLPNEMFWDDDDFIHNNRYIKDFDYWRLWFSQTLWPAAICSAITGGPFFLIIFAIESALSGKTGSYDAYGMLLALVFIF